MSHQNVASLPDLRGAGVQGRAESSDFYNRFQHVAKIYKDYCFHICL